MKESIKKVREEASKLMEAEKPDEAERELRAALQHHPDDLDLLSLLGIIQARLHKEDEAESTFRRILAIDPCHEEAACALGRILDNSLRTEEAEVLYKDVLTKRPDSHCALDDYCRLLLSEDREEEALKIARDHVKQHPEFVEAYDGIRYVLAKKEDRLEGILEATDPDSDLVNALFRTMLEQLETVQAVLDKVDVKTIPEDTLADLEEEQIRLKVEIGHLRTQMSRLGLSIEADLDSRIKSVLQDG
ncbi:MAG: tetratricopeptide repeat protein [Promethearchaeota archaeon]